MDDLLVNRHAGTHKLLGEVIGFQQMRAERNEDVANGGFSGSNAAGEANFQQVGSGGRKASVIGRVIFFIGIFTPPGLTQQFYPALENSGMRLPRRSLAARTVLDMSMAMVSGPTPPGTGVSAPATSATSG